jgi:hypothetical protein
MAAAISASVLSFLGMSPVDPLSFAVVSATWAGFIYATAMGRMPAFSMRDWMVPLISMAPGAMAATIVVLLMAMGNGLVISMGILLGIVCAFISGLLGHVFVNDGKTLALIWGPQDYLLPYAGERCCVQGHRGWISHFDWQEYSYDFAISEGDPVLCSREGHIIAYKQDRTGTEMGSGNSHANYVKVKHRDGSIAEYLHGMQDGVTAVNAGLSALSTPQATNPAEASYRRVDNVHVHAGQQLCKAGNVGISMFAHIHFCVKRAPTEAPNPGPAEADSPTKFKDADVAGHEGRCYSMRFYKSDNVNRGPVRTP